MLRDLNFFFWKIFFIWTIFKAFIEFVTLLFLFYVLGFFFGHETCRIWAPQPGIKPLLALEAEVLTSGPREVPKFFSVESSNGGDLPYLDCDGDHTNPWNSIELNAHINTHTHT